MLLVLSLNLLLAVLRSRSAEPGQSVPAWGRSLLPKGSTLLGRLAPVRGIPARASAEQGSRASL